MIITVFLPQNLFSQNLGSAVNYEARDSIVANIPTQKVRLYGEAIVEFEDIVLTADFIEIDLKTSEIIATYTLDSAGAPVGKPVFTSGGEESRCDYIKYNFNTKKGYVKEIRAQQDEGYIHMAEAKVHPNEEVHLYDGKYTTCDADTPHYHFKLTKAIIVPDERIVTGPIYMKLFKIPMPLAAPFAYLPNSDTKKHGIILPKFANTDNSFGLQDFGYYIPLGAYWETYFYGTIFTTGRFGVRNNSNYFKKYKYTGGVGLKFEQFRGKFYDPEIANKWTFNWRHTQDSKAHPTLKFSADINFKSDNNGKTSLDPINTEYFDNQFNSAVNLTKRWKAGKFSGSMALKLSLQQNGASNNYTMELPTYNLSVNRFNLGVLRKSSVGKKWYENINVTYTMNARNKIAARATIFTQDSLYALDDYVLNGVEQSAIMQANLRLFGSRVMVNPTATYKEIWNFQSEDFAWDNTNDTLLTTDLNGFRASRNLSLSASANFNFFGYYKFAGKSQTKFRHVASTSAGFNYTPDIGLYQKVQIDSVGNTKYYSPFQNSLYHEYGQGNSASITFGLSNTLEMKKRDKKDTLNDSMKNFKLVDAFSISGGYNFLAESKNLSRINFAFRTARFLNIFSFQTGAVLSPYSYNDTTGVELEDYAWTSSQGIGRIKSANAAITANFTNSKGRNKQKELDENTKDDANANGLVTKPGLISFEIPWQVNLSYNLKYTSLSKLSGGSYIDTLELIQTLRVDGDFNINEKWKFAYGINFDLQAPTFLAGIPYSQISIWRDLHCWEASLNLVKYEGWDIAKWPTFLLRVNIKASMFSDLPIEIRRLPFTF